MHELSVCQGLLGEVERIAREHGARGADRLVVQIGPLAGVEPRLLADAFPIASAGTLAEGAELVIESLPVRVFCPACGRESEASVNKLLCAHCGDWQTRLAGGDELILASVGLLIDEATDNSEG